MSSNGALASMNSRSRGGRGADASRGDDNGRGQPREQRRGRPKCSHPSCGRFGHWESQCWTAHPELRPDIGNRSCGGLGRGRVGRRRRGRGPSRGGGWTSNSFDDLSAMSKALSPKPSFVPFRLFDLPLEIQNKIYQHLYEKEYGIMAGMSEGILCLRGRSNFLPSYKLELACRKTRDDSHLIRKNAFNGHLQVSQHEKEGLKALSILFLDNFSWVRTRVTKLTIGSFSGRSMPGSDVPELWKEVFNHFPHVKEVELHYSIVRRQHEDRDSDMETAEWKETCRDGYQEAFLAGEMDEDFDYPADILDAHDLARYAEDASHDCMIYLKTSVEWLSNRYHHVYSQEVKFLVTSASLEAVERR